MPKFAFLTMQLFCDWKHRIDNQIGLATSFKNGQHPLPPLTATHQQHNSVILNIHSLVPSTWSNRTPADKEMTKIELQ